jgi:hypothetical protein
MGCKRFGRAFLAAVLLTTVLATGAAAATGWKVHRKPAAHLKIATPRAWTEIAPSPSTPGVVFQAFDPRARILGVQIVKLPDSLKNASLAMLTQMFVAAIKRQPVEGAIHQRRVRLPAGEAEDLSYIVSPPKRPKLFIDEFLLTTGGDWSLAFLAPAAAAARDTRIFLRSAKSFRVI